jgi:hypothetical protein
MTTPLDQFCTRFIVEPRNPQFRNSCKNRWEQRRVQLGETVRGVLRRETFQAILTEYKLVHPGESNSALRERFKRDTIAFASRVNEAILMASQRQRTAFLEALIRQERDLLLSADSGQPVLVTDADGHPESTEKGTKSKYVYAINSTVLLGHTLADFLSEVTTNVHDYFPCRHCQRITLSVYWATQIGRFACPFCACRYRPGTTTEATIEALKVFLVCDNTDASSFRLIWTDWPHETTMNLTNEFKSITMGLREEHLQMTTTMLAACVYEAAKASTPTVFQLTKFTDQMKAALDYNSSETRGRWEYGHIPEDIPFLQGDFIKGVTPVQSWKDTIRMFSAVRMLQERPGESFDFTATGESSSSTGTI